MPHIFHQPGGSTSSPPTIFLPGWGFDGRICELMEPPPAWFYPLTPIDPTSLINELLAFLETRKLRQAVLIGWSMGANLALDFAREHPDRVSTLILIAMRRHWPSAEIEAIRRELLEEPTTFLAAFYRKCFLGHKEGYKRFKARFPSPAHPDIDIKILTRGLDYLQQTSCQPAPGVQTRLLHGADDIIVPLAQRARLPEASMEIVAHTGHMPFLASNSSIRPDEEKQFIKRRFSRAAATYDHHALLQKELAGRLDSMLGRQVEATAIKKVLEIGCGTGGYTGLLAERFPGADITALDFSPQMIAAAEKKLTGKANIHFVCEDGEHFLATCREQTFDLITSNATIHWFAGLQAALAHAARSLRPGGLLAASIFGRTSLQELDRAISRIVTNRHRLAAAGFPDQHLLEKFTEDIFAEVKIDTQTVTRQYASCTDLLQQLKKTGTTGRGLPAAPLLSRSRLAELDRWFVERYGGCQVTYEMFLLFCRK
jgi:malonyl-CoA O-methyltransferase